MEALTTQIAADEAELIDRLYETDQVGYLNAIVSSSPRIAALSVTSQGRLSAYAGMIELLTACLLSSAHELDFVAAQLDIPIVFLKGIHTSAAYYSQPSIRYIRDIDVLVPHGDAPRLYQAALRMGFVQGDYDWLAKRITTDSQPVQVEKGIKYELPRLVKIVTCECDPVLLSTVSLAENSTIQVRDNVAYVPIGLEIHYALTPEFPIPADSFRPDDTLFAHGQYLTPDCCLIYLAFKAYVDIVVHHSLRGIKLFADALRLIKKDGHKIHWNEIVVRSHEAGVCAPLRYVLFHAENLYRINIGDTSVQCPCVDAGSSPLDFGDFLPRISGKLQPFRLGNVS